jgi:hypothetical protein
VPAVKIPKTARGGSSVNKSEITAACLMQVIKNCNLDGKTNTWIADQIYKIILEARIEGAVGEVVAK